MSADDLRCHGNKFSEVLGRESNATSITLASTQTSMTAGNVDVVTSEPHL